MGYGILNRRIFFELVKFTSLAMAGISAVLTIVGAMVEAGRKGIDPIRTLTLMPYLVPPTFPYTLPACLLLACTIVYGGMSGANEITAAKSAGIHVLRLFEPALLLGVALAVLGIYLSDRFIPLCNLRCAEVILNDVEGSLYAYLNLYGCIAEMDFPYEIYVQAVQGRKLLHPVIKHRRPDSSYDMLASAYEATLEVVVGDTGEKKVLLHLLDGVASSSAQNVAHFNEKSVEMPVPHSIRTPEDKSESLTFRGCRKKAAERHAEVNNLDTEIATIGVFSALGGDPLWVSQKLDPNRMEADRLLHKARQVEAEVHVRLAQAAATIPFVLIGFPISILFRRRDFLQSFFVCFLPVITIFYPAMILAFNIFKESEDGSLLTLWAPMIVMCIAVVPFMRRVIRY